MMVASRNKSSYGIKKAAAALLAGLLVLLLPGCSQEQSGGQLPEAVGQPDWSQWSDSLPAYVTRELYQIEERREYRSRTLETTISTDSDSLDGWELYATLDDLGGYGEWSDWTEENLTASETRQVETKTQYRSREKERSTSGSSVQEGWELENITYVEGDYGEWSAWSETAVSATADRQVELKTQYRARSIRYESGYSDWGAWSDWSGTSVAASQTCQVEIRVEGAETQYRYRTRAYIENMPVYGEWGSYSDTPLSASSTQQVESRLVYRSRTREQEPVYHYWRWGSWSQWTEEPITGTADLQVETGEVCRYRDQLTGVTYYFRRWGDWSGYSAEPVTASERLQVEVSAEYRFKDK